jgi:hypothetical protein
LEIVSDLVFEVQEFEGKKVFQCTLIVIHQITGQEMRLGLNKANVKNLAKVYGICSQNWMGKIIGIAAKIKYLNGEEGFIYGST